MTDIKELRREKDNLKNQKQKIFQNLNKLIEKEKQKAFDATVPINNKLTIINNQIANDYTKSVAAKNIKKIKKSLRL